MEADLLAGIDLFNDGRYWHAHEAWERAWVGLPKGSDERRFYQGLIQLAAAFLHRERAKAAPAVRCYRSSMAKLDGLPDLFLEMDLAALRLDASRCFEPVAAGEPESAWPPAPRLEPR